MMGNLVKVGITCLYINNHVSGIGLSDIKKQNTKNFRNQYVVLTYIHLTTNVIVLAAQLLVSYHLLLLIDIDECRGRNGRRLCPLSNTICVNKPGSHACECRKGHKWLEDGSCEGIAINHGMVQCRCYIC